MTNKEKQSAAKERSRKWYAAHKEETKARAKEWKKRNPDKVRASARRYWAANKDEILASMTDDDRKKACERARQWVLNNPARARATRLAWEHANPGKVKAAKARYRARHPYVRLTAEQRRRWQGAKRVVAANDETLSEAIVRLPLCELVASIGDVPGVYCIENLVNGKKYIGASKKILNRFGRHRRQLRSGKHENTHLQAAWDLHGESSFIFYPMATCGIDCLASVEVRLITDLRTTDKGFGYNIEWGGQQNHRVADETKAKIREKLVGHTLSDMSCEKIRLAHQKQVLQMTPDGKTVKSFQSVLEASSITGINRHGIGACCNGHNKTAGGYRWRYATINEVQRSPTAAPISGGLRWDIR